GHNRRMHVTRIIQSAVVSTLLVAGVQAQNAPAAATITSKLDTPQARVYVATLQPHTPSRSPNGHATNRVLVYLDEGVMTVHEAGAQHEHILNRVVVYLNDQPGARADDVRMAGAATHTEQNASDQPADRIAIEIK